MQFLDMHFYPLKSLPPWSYCQWYRINWWPRKGIFCWMRKHSADTVGATWQATPNESLDDKISVMDVTKFYEFWIIKNKVQVLQKIELFCWIQSALCLYNCRILIGEWWVWTCYYSRVCTCLWPKTIAVYM